MDLPPKGKLRGQRFGNPSLPVTTEKSKYPASIADLLCHLVVAEAFSLHAVLVESENAVLQANCEKGTRLEMKIVSFICVSAVLLYV